jgi:hypothetical protein
MLRPGVPTPQEIEAARLRLEQATADFRQANRERDRLFAVSRDLGNTADGAVAVQQAMVQQQAALLRLREAPHDFQALTSPKQPA